MAKATAAQDDALKGSATEAEASAKAGAEGLKVEEAKKDDAAKMKKTSVEAEEKLAVIKEKIEVKATSKANEIANEKTPAKRVEEEKAADKDDKAAQDEEKQQVLPRNRQKWRRRRIAVHKKKSNLLMLAKLAAAAADAADQARSRRQVQVAVAVLAVAACFLLIQLCTWEDLRTNVFSLSFTVGLEIGFGCLASLSPTRTSTNTKVRKGAVPRSVPVDVEVSTKVVLLTPDSPYYCRNVAGARRDTIRRRPAPPVSPLQATAAHKVRLSVE